jgi:serine/threonine protein kinase
MLLENGEVKVTDFGIARVVSSSQTKTGVVMGSPSYMSPEQVAGKKVDGRSDLFSLGVVLYEMLAGERPFRGESIATIMFQITSSPPPPMAEFVPKLPPSSRSWSKRRWPRTRPRDSRRGRSSRRRSVL